MFGFACWFWLGSLLLLMDDLTGSFDPLALVLFRRGFVLSKLFHLFAGSRFELVLGLLVTLVILWLVFL
jgi:hypothetical protein